MPRMLALIRPAFLFLPDLVGYVFAMAGLSLIFMPEELKLLDKYRRTRLGIALVIFLVGLGAVISNSVQKQEDSRSAQSERDNARAERDKLMMQIARLVAGQAEAAQDTRLARSETRSVRGELDNARKELLASQAANGTATTQTVTTLVTASTSQLQEQIERAKLLPPNPAKLSFGFYSSDVSLFPIMDQAIHPDADGIFILEILGKNTSDVLASRVELWVNLCVECTFVKDPEGFDKLPG